MHIYEIPNKSLKPFAALTWTVQTGAASHYRAGSSCRLALRYREVSAMRKVLFILMILVPSICNSDELKSKINEVSCIKSTGNENFIESCVVNIEINPMHAGNNLMCYGELELHG